MTTSKSYKKIKIKIEGEEKKKRANSPKAKKFSLFLFNVRYRERFHLENVKLTTFSSSPVTSQVMKRFVDILEAVYTIFRRLLFRKFERPLFFKCKITLSVLFYYLFSTLYFVIILSPYSIFYLFNLFFIKDYRCFLCS